MTPKPAVRLDHVSFIRNHTYILHDISLRIEKGQHWAIIGPNGSGKTSLISIINGYHQPSEGKAEVLGRRFGKTDLRELRLHIGEAGSEIKNMVHPQDSVTDIVLSGKFASIGLYEMPSEKDMERAGELLDAVQKMCEPQGGLVLILVTHHIEEIVPGFTHALALRRGRVVAKGDKKDVLTGKVLSSTFDLGIEVQERYGRLWTVIKKS